MQAEEAMSEGKLSCCLSIIIHNRLFCKKGLLTPAERASVSSICGHSSAVAKDYYLLRDRVRDARNCAELSRLLCGADAESSDADADLAVVDGYKCGTESSDIGGDEDVEYPADVESSDTDADAASAVVDDDGDECGTESSDIGGDEDVGWGSEHPSPTHVKRAKWTPKERAWLKRLAKEVHLRNRRACKVFGVATKRIKDLHSRYNTN